MSGLLWPVAPQVIAREYQLIDAPALFAATDNNRSYLRQWLPWLDVNLTVENSTAFIRQTQQGLAEGTSLILGLWHQPTAQLLGNFGFNQIADGQASIGYWLAAAWQGQGIIHAACQRLIAYGFQELGLTSLTIATAVTNLPSQAVARKLGFNYLKTLANAEWLYDHYVDHHIYQLTRDSWVNLTYLELTH